MKSIRTLLILFSLVLFSQSLSAGYMHPVEKETVEKAITLILNKKSKELNELICDNKWLPRYAFNPRKFTDLRKTILADGSNIIFVARLFSSDECLNVLLSHVGFAGDKDVAGITYKQLFPGNESDDEDIYADSDDEFQEVVLPVPLDRDYASARVPSGSDSDDASICWPLEEDNFDRQSSISCGEASACVLPTQEIFFTTLPASGKSMNAKPKSIVVTGEYGEQHETFQGAILPVVINYP